MQIIPILVHFTYNMLERRDKPSSQLLFFILSSICCLLGLIFFVDCRTLGWVPGFSLKQPRKMSKSRTWVAIIVGFAKAFSHSHLNPACTTIMFVLPCLARCLFFSFLFCCYYFDWQKKSSGSSEMVTHTQKTSVNKYKLKEERARVSERERGRERRVYAFLSLHLAMAILSSSLFQAHFTNTSQALFSVFSPLAILEKSKLRIRWKPLKINRINL